MCATHKVQARLQRGDSSLSLSIVTPARLSAFSLLPAHSLSLLLAHSLPSASSSWTAAPGNGRKDPRRGILKVFFGRLCRTFQLLPFVRVHHVSRVRGHFAFDVRRVRSSELVQRLPIPIATVDGSFRWYRVFPTIEWNRRRPFVYFFPAWVRWLVKMQIGTKSGCTIDLSFTGLEFLSLTLESPKWSKWPFLKFLFCRTYNSVFLKI